MSMVMKHLRGALGEPEVPRPHLHPRRVGGSLYVDVVWEQPIGVRAAGAHLHLIAAGLEVESTGRWLVAVEPGIADAGNGRTWGTIYVELWDGSDAEFAQVEGLVVDVAGQLGLEVRRG